MPQGGVSLVRFIPEADTDGDEDVLGSWVRFTTVR